MPSEQQDKLKQLGNTLVQKQEYEQAAKFYDRALELDSTSESSAAIFSNRSLCLLNTKKYNEALQDAERAISLRPTWHRGYQRAAAACEKLNKSEEGFKHLEKCFELDEASKSDAALKKMKEDFELNIIKHKAPSMTQDELKQIGNNFVKNQQYESAITVYTLAIEKDAFCDEAVPILSNRSMAYFKIGKYKEAYEDGGCCCGIKPDWAKGFMRRGVAAEKLGEWQIALESYDEYLKVDPRDEAGVKSSRNAVAKVVADLKKAEEAERREREKAALELENTTDPAELSDKSYWLLITSATVFDIEGMKIALKQPCNVRFDTPFFLSALKDASADSRAFYPATLASARTTLATSPESKDITNILVVLISFFGDKTRPEKISVARQVEYLDFLLDVAEEQDISAPNLRMRQSLEKICWHDPASSDHTSIRKDLIFTLFNRIDTARKMFHGKKASNKEFASDVLFTMCSELDPKRNQFLQRSDVSSDVCSQDMYECICTAIEAGADPNINTSSHSGAHTLDSAVVNLRSLKVVELLLRHKADPNAFGFSEERLMNGSSYTTKVTQSSPLSHALLTYRPDIIRALLRCGAKVPTEKLPDFALKCVPPSKNPLVKAECPSSLVVSFLCIERKPYLIPLVNEEYIQLWFEVIAAQNLSFLCPGGSGRLGTPLTVAIENCLDVQLLALMIKLKPALLKMVCFPSPDQRPLFGVTPLGMMLTASQLPHFDVPYLQSVAQLLMENGIDFKKDAAQCYFENDKSDKIDQSLSGLVFVDQLNARGSSNEKMQMLKNFMMMKK